MKDQAPGEPSERAAQQLAEAVRAACLTAARQAYQDAAVGGLCAEGAAEAATGAIAGLDLAQIIAQSGRCAGAPEPTGTR